MNLLRAEALTTMTDYKSQSTFTARGKNLQQSPSSAHSPSEPFRRSLPPLSRGRRSEFFAALIKMLGNPVVKYIDTGEAYPHYTAPQIRELQRSRNAGFEYVTPTLQWDAPPSLYWHLKREGREDLIIEHCIVAVPNFLLNALVCEALEKSFPRHELLSCPGFILREGSLRLDLDDSLSRRGFMVPVMRNGLIDSLRVFRYPNDIGFTLRSRPGEVALDA